MGTVLLVGLAPSMVGLAPLVTIARQIRRMGLTAAAAAAVALCARSASAAPLTQLAQGYDYGGRHDRPYYYDYRPPACPYRYHWECWIDPYGRQGCGCRPDFGLYRGFY